MEDGFDGKFSFFVVVDLLISFPYQLLLIWR